MCYLIIIVQFYRIMYGIISGRSSECTTSTSRIPAERGSRRSPPDSSVKSWQTTASSKLNKLCIFRGNIRISNNLLNKLLSTWCFSKSLETYGTWFECILHSMTLLTKVTTLTSDDLIKVCNVPQNCCYWCKGNSCNNVIMLSCLHCKKLS